MRKSLRRWTRWTFETSRPLVTLAVAAWLAMAASQTVAQNPAEGKPDKDGWISLFDGKTLGNWKSTAFGGEGEVKVQDGAIVLAMGNNMTGVTWSGKAPKTNYEIALEGKRVEGMDFFCTTTFPVGNDPCSLVVGGWGGSVVGLSSIDGQDASENQTTKQFDFTNKQWYAIRIRVTKEKIEAWIGKEKAVDQELKDHKISIRAECELSRPLGISSYGTTGAVRNIRIRNLTPGEIKAAQSPQ